MKTVEVKAVWFNDSGDASIVLLVPLDKKRKLRNDLFWYSGSNMPSWKSGQQLSDKEVMETKCYKQRKFDSVEQDIPNDCYMSMF